MKRINDLGLNVPMAIDADFDFDECYRTRIVDVVDGVEISLIDLEHLKRNKKASGRAKDIADLENL